MPIALFYAPRAQRCWQIWLSLALVLLLHTIGAGSEPTAPSAPSAPATPEKSLVVGHEATAFVAPDLHGTPVALQAYRGQPVILNFWATWCAPCRREMPALQSVYEAQRPAGLVILALSQDVQDNMEMVRTYVANAGLTFPTLLDPAGQVAGLFHVFLLPSTVFINRAGVVTAMHLGPITPEQLTSYLAAIMP
jgi:peroxiredoxin